MFLNNETLGTPGGNKICVIFQHELDITCVELKTLVITLNKWSHVCIPSKTICHDFNILLDPVLRGT